MNLEDLETEREINRVISKVSKLVSKRDSKYFNKDLETTYFNNPEEKRDYLISRLGIRAYKRLSRA